MRTFTYADADNSAIVVTDGDLTFTVPVDPGQSDYRAILSGVADGSVTVENFVPVAADVDLDAYLATARWKFETGGLNVSGVSIATDRESQALINGAFNLVQAMPDQIIKFKSAAGWVELDAVAMTAIAITVGQHIQAAFALEATLAAEITAGTVTTTEEIDAAFAAA